MKTHTNCRETCQRSMDGGGECCADGCEMLAGMADSKDAKPIDAPWTFYAKLSGSENHRGFSIADGSGWVFATVQPGDADGNLGEERARLIAAAPELLEALQGICNEQDERQGYASCDAYDKARAAIAKATGEQQ